MFLQRLIEYNLMILQIHFSLAFYQIFEISRFHLFFPQNTLGIISGKTMEKQRRLRFVNK